MNGVVLRMKETESKKGSGTKSIFASKLSRIVSSQVKGVAASNRLQTAMIRIPSL